MSFNYKMACGRMVRGRRRGRREGNLEVGTGIITAGTKFHASRSQQNRIALQREGRSPDD